MKVCRGLNRALPLRRKILPQCRKFANTLKIKKYLKSVPHHFSVEVKTPPHHTTMPKGHTKAGAFKILHAKTLKNHWVQGTPRSETDKGHGQQEQQQQKGITGVRNWTLSFLPQFGAL